MIFACFYKLRGASKLFSVAIDSMSQMPSIKLNLYWTQNVHNTICSAEKACGWFSNYIIILQLQ